MTADEALKTLDKTLKANAKRPAGTRPLMDRSGCTHPGCTKCDSKAGKR
ncbi:hypothetical protein [Nonomuraea sp. SBT364]|nr:hypothetical protein [Nonomuraea sp. SBT364]